MAATSSLCLSLDPQHHHSHRLLLPKTLPFSPATSILIPKCPIAISHNINRYSFKPSCHSHSSTTTTTTTTAAEDTPSTPTTSIPKLAEEPLRVGRFLSNQEYEELRFLENFRYHQELESGSMWVQVMRSEDMDITVGLLAESFAESMLLPNGYVALLGFLVKQYLTERRELMPHTATLIAFYRRREDENFEGEEGGDENEVELLAGTVEVCFDKMGANASTPTPTPPKNSPYISNMAVKKSLRRRGIGWHLLKASEELITEMSSSREVYLHCRMIDAAPFNMYTRAGYGIVKTDSILVLLMLQRRKHLMCKELPDPTSLSESEDLSSDEQ